jgi:hypothetical protein
VAGLACARALDEAGLAVTVFDKARGPGGRTSTRRTDRFQFDHGAQYFTVRDPRFRSLVDALRSEGVVERWEGVIVALQGGEVSCRKDTLERFVGVPGMNALTKHLAARCSVRYATRVASCTPAVRGWRLRSESGEDLGAWQRVVISAPPEQSAALLESAGSILARSVSAVPMAPCWAVMAGWEEPVPVELDGAFVSGSPLSWIARNSSKPGRARAESWVLHASPQWSREHLESPAEEVAERLLAELGRQISVVRPPVHLQAHRWRYALPEEPLASPCLVDRELGLVTCGDWCDGPRVEDAYLSGVAAADAVRSR